MNNGLKFITKQNTKNGTTRNVKGSSLPSFSSMSFESRRRKERTGQEKKKTEFIVEFDSQLTPQGVQSLNA